LEKINKKETSVYKGEVCVELDYTVELLERLQHKLGELFPPNL
jgi:hypothetical protein